MRRLTTRVTGLAVLGGILGVVLLWAAGVFAAAIGVWQYAILSLLLGTGLGLVTLGVQHVRRGRGI